MIAILNMIKHEIIESIETLITGFGKVGGKKNYKWIPYFVLKY